MRHVIPNTNVCISATLKDGGAFAGVPVTSLNCYGTNHRIPRVTSNISVDTHFRNRCFVRFCCIHSSDTAFISTVCITSPISTTAAASIATNCCLVFDTSVQSTITISWNEVAGGKFIGIFDENGSGVYFGPKPATLSLTDTAVYESARLVVCGKADVTSS
jgi:hypothetical protein